MAFNDQTDPSLLDSALNGRDTSHPNPMFDFLSGFVPRRLKDLFKWAEYLVFNSAHIYAVVKKFGEYPITELIFETESPSEIKMHKEIFEKHLKARGFLTMASFDKFIYGNGFYSLYKPFKRFLVCSANKCAVDINYINYKFERKKFQFSYLCPSCKVQTVGKIDDRKMRDPSKLRIIRWDPKMMDIEYNPITGEAVYYYTIPKAIKDGIEKGNKNLINTMPIEFLHSVKEGKIFRFDKEALFHMKVPGPAGVEAQWGFPPITSAIKLFLFAAVLRKANEAISLEHIAPFRIMYPVAASNNGDPITTISMSKWKNELDKNLRRWRRDPLHIMFSPIPTEVKNIGGDGRAMLTLGEIQEAEKNIVLSMGVPLEFLTGGLGQTRGEITLRMLENQLQTHVEDMNGLLEWIEIQVAAYMGVQPIEVRLADFVMIDDTERKQLLLQLWQAGKVSDSTIAEIFELDLINERKKIKEDTLAQARAEQELMVAKQKLQESLSTQVQTQAAMQSSGGLGYDQQAVLAKADMMVQEFAQMDPGTRRSRMDALQGEDAVMYACVKDRMEQAQQNSEADAKAQGGAR